MTLGSNSPTPLQRISPKLFNGIEQTLRRIPFVRRRLEQEYAHMMNELQESVHPYRNDHPIYRQLPAQGLDRQAILDEMQDLAQQEEGRWIDGFASGAVYHGDPEHIEFLNRVYALNSQSNPLHADLWPSTIKYEAEIASMVGAMLGAEKTDDEVCGTISSGGTESILLAMKVYRDRARAERGIEEPEMVLPTTAHAAFDKAAHYFKIKQVRIPVDSGYRADVDAARNAINKNTIVLVGSAPSYPHGVIDPIQELSELARRNRIGFHTDACLGGFVLPWAERLGATVPAFDFRLPGVTSISVDTHKYGYAAKGTSVILYRSRELRRFQFYTTADWPGGLYYSPSLAGSRPGALSAACWAALVSIGEGGYLTATSRILAAAWIIRRWIEQIPELEVLGDPLWVIAFGSRTINIYQVMDEMSRRGWSLNGLHRPAAIHLCVTLRHTQPGVAQRFISDLRAAVAQVKANPSVKDGMAPVYGMAANMPLRGVVRDILARYVDILYEI